MLFFLCRNLYIHITIQVDESQNEINLYYTKRTDIKYKVEYYYNGEKDEEETEEKEATYKEQIRQNKRKLCISNGIPFSSTNT